MFGQAGAPRDFVYFYIGAFAGGGIVLNGGLYGGPTGNAGALGSMPVPGPDGKPRQLIDVASIAMLEKALNARGVDASHLWTSPQDWGEIGAELDDWIASAANGARLRDRRGLLGHRLRGGGDRRLDAAGRARAGWSTPSARRSSKIDGEGLDAAAGARRHCRHPCAGAGRRQPAAVRALPDRFDRRMSGS